MGDRTVPIASRLLPITLKKESYGQGFEREIKFW